MVEGREEGRRLETVLDFTHSLYYNTHDVWVSHNGVRGRFLPSGGKPKFIPDPDKSAPDYYGCDNGKFLAFDAKSTKEEKKWSLDRRSFHQLERLIWIAKAGGIAWFAIESRPTDILWLVRVASKDNIYSTFKVDFVEGPNVLKAPLKPENYYDWLPEARKWYG